MSKVYFHEPNASDNTNYYICMYVYKYSVDKYLLCMIKVRVRWCTCSLWVENVITLSKLIGLLLLF